MTTPLVQSISDEQLAELEQMASNEFFSDDNDACVMFGELRGLIARLRAAEADARRYRWIAEHADVDCRGHAPDADYNTLAERIDAAMERTP